ncbi:FMN-binding protein [Propionibacterium australiense]|uniref:FMN-binding domain n=1 Tax=Propionibacterium australiense TaxID=119981 RepID=A0A383S3L2_9ACTN|nr:FMN-binding protein [Propionibacterium australiense]RLP11920.1 FMN-binding protein [Propionibacterium australiense]RLP12558.1 FMN-binding protein [Propionibacterium australiense]SYZ32618.1 FMN-binding domain [Propionibacterium australiense]VEH91631.1 Major membrane immunogen, membrane-anchored lipoprotein [Propionibacterium australiense]
MNTTHRGLTRRFAAFAGLGAVGAMMLTACSGDDELVDMGIPMSDGTYTGQSNEDDQGSVGTVTITVEGGRIIEASYETVESDGTVKDENYGKDSSGEIANAEYYQRAQAAVASYEQYSAALVEAQDPTAVDTISGATVAHSQFLQAALRAVYQAQGVEDDGRADTINMPGLGLEDEDY